MHGPRRDSGMRPLEERDAVLALVVSCRIDDAVHASGMAVDGISPVLGEPVIKTVGYIGRGSVPKQARAEEGGEAKRCRDEDAADATRGEAGLGQVPAYEGAVEHAFHERRPFGHAEVADAVASRWASRIG